AIVEVRGGLPEPAQGRRVESLQGVTEALPGGRPEGAHVVELPRRAVREVRAAVAVRAPGASKDLEPAPPLWCQRAIGRAEGAGVHAVEGRHVRREGVQLRAEARLRVPQGRVAGALGELLVREEPLSAEGAADVVLEVLQLVEVGAPVQPPLAGAAPPEERGRVAEALTPVGEVPHHAVLEAVEVTARAGDVAVLAHAA